METETVMIMFIIILFMLTIQLSHNPWHNANVVNGFLIKIMPNHWPFITRWLTLWLTPWLTSTANWIRDCMVALRIAWPADWLYHTIWPNSLFSSVTGSVKRSATPWWIANDLALFWCETHWQRSHYARDYARVVLSEFRHNGNLFRKAKCRTSC